MFVLETRIITRITIIISHKSSCAQTRQPRMAPSNPEWGWLQPWIPPIRLIISQRTWPCIRHSCTYCTSTKSIVFFFHMYPLKDSLIHPCPLLSVGLKSTVIFFLMCCIYIYIFIQSIKQPHGRHDCVLVLKVPLLWQMVSHVQFLRGLWGGRPLCPPATGECYVIVIWWGASSISMRKVSMGVSPMSLKKNRCSKHFSPMERRAGSRSNSLANLHTKTHNQTPKKNPRRMYN